jgi:hypothetical protein
MIDNSVGKKEKKKLRWLLPFQLNSTFRSVGWSY